MDFIEPDAEELALLRADPLLWEQELDVRPDVALDLEHAVGTRAGVVFWRSRHDHLYSLELADLGRGRPSMAKVNGWWDRFEPRPPEHEIDADLADSVPVGGADGGKPRPRGRPPRLPVRVERPRGWPKGSVLRTPDQRFAELPGFAWEPRYVEIEGLRMAYVEAGVAANGSQREECFLLLHGEPTWGYLYRHMIPALAAVGRVVVPDLIGFGRSDKPALPQAYSYRSHARWLHRFVESLDLRGVTMVCQDWGGLLGLRVLARDPERYRRVVPMNTGFPCGEAMPEAFLAWRRWSQTRPEIDVPAMMRRAVRRADFTAEEAAAYGVAVPDARASARGAHLPAPGARPAPIIPAPTTIGARPRCCAVSSSRCCRSGATPIRSPDRGSRPCEACLPRPRWRRRSGFEAPATSCRRTRERKWRRRSPRGRGEGAILREGSPLSRESSRWHGRSTGRA